MDEFYILTNNNGDTCFKFQGEGLSVWITIPKSRSVDDIDIAVSRDDKPKSQLDINTNYNKLKSISAILGGEHE